MGEVRIAVIGAGIAGLACASELTRADARVTVFERSRVVGGRLATRHGNACVFDHGAQFLTARGQRFLDYVNAASRSGLADRWRPRIVEDDRTLPEPIEDWWVGSPGMSALVRPLVRSLDIRHGIGVHELLRSQRGWELQTDAGRPNDEYRAVAIALPAPQATSLLGLHGRAFRHLHEVRMGPCWSAMLAFDEPIDAGADCMRWSRGPLAWAACNASKPGRAQQPQTWVLHASRDWSRAHLEADHFDVASLLYHSFAAKLDVALPRPAHLTAHRWRHATVERPLGRPCLIDEEMSAGACGDWCTGSRVEAAYDSGRALAHSLLSMVGLAAPARRG